MRKYPTFRFGCMLTALFVCMFVHAAKKYVPKREFRGAWIQCVNGQFQGLSTAAMQQNLLNQLDEL